MLIWSKLQLDQWLETSLGRLNLELRSSLSSQKGSEHMEESAVGTGLADDILGHELLVKVEDSVNRLSSFVFEQQASFKQVWDKECRSMITAATIFLFVSSALAIAITAGMFWLFLKNHMENTHKAASTHFAVCTLCGLFAPLIYASVVSVFCKTSERRQLVCADDFQDCIECPANMVEGMTLSTAEQPGRIRVMAQWVADAARSARRSIRRGESSSSSREIFEGGRAFEGDPGTWTQMTDEIVPMAQRCASRQQAE